MEGYKVRQIFLVWEFIEIKLGSFIFDLRIQLQFSDEMGGNCLMIKEFWIVLNL